MRIAISGTHFSGKSTLVTSLLKELPNYVSIDEPYVLLEQEGYECSDPPLLEDFEQHFERSIAVIQGSQNNTIFDRCPLDCLAYALAVTEDFSFDIESWIQKMENAIQRLDFIIFIPIEYRDRIPLPASEDLKLRITVDEKLQEMILEDSLAVLKTIKVLEVTGSLEERVREVKSQIVNVKS